MTEPVEWRVLTPPTRAVRWGEAVLIGLVVGGGLSLPAIAAAEAAELALLPFAAGLVAAPSALAAVLGAYRGARERTPLADGLAIDVAELRWLPVAGVLAAGTLLLVPAIGEDSAITLGLLAVALGSVGFVAFAALRGSGRFDPDSGTASFDGRLYDLARAPATPVRLGGLTVLVVRRPVADPLQRYGVLAMPTRVYAEVRRAIGR